MIKMYGIVLCLIGFGLYLIFKKKEDIDPVVTAETSLNKKLKEYEAAILDKEVQQVETNINELKENV